MSARRRCRPIAARAHAGRLAPRGLALVGRQEGIVAITGAVLVLYVVAHVLGNLKAFQGGGDEAPRSTPTPSGCARSASR